LHLNTTNQFQIWFKTRFTTNTNNWSFWKLNSHFWRCNSVFTTMPPR